MALMEITTNIACRVQCDFCPHEMIIEEYSNRTKSNNISYGQPAQMSFEIFKQCLEKLPKSVKIAFSGYSEPFLNPDCSKMIRYAHERGFTIQLYSTLVGMKLEDIDKFKHIPFDMFHIHLADSSNHAKIAVNKYYLDLLKKILTLIPNVTSMSMGNLHPKIKEIVDTETGSSLMISRAGNLENVKHVQKKMGPITCNRMTTFDLIDKLDENVLLPNGDVALCCNDYGLQNILGNLTEIDYDEIFTGKVYREIFQKIKSEGQDVICRHCEEAIPDSELKNKQDIQRKFKTDKNAFELIQLYKVHLERFPDEEGFKAYYSRLVNDRISLTDIENEIKKSHEYQSGHNLQLKLKNNVIV